MPHSSFEEAQEDMAWEGFAGALEEHGRQKAQELKQQAYALYHSPKWRFHRFLVRWGFLQGTVFSYEQWQATVDALYDYDKLSEMMRVLPEEVKRA